MSEEILGKIRSWVGKFLVAFGVWTLIGLYYHLISLPSSVRDYDSSLKWLSDTPWNLLQFYVWGLIYPFISAVGHRYPITRQNILKSIFIYIPFGLLVHVIYTVIYVSFYWMLGGAWRPEPKNFLDGLWSMIIVSTRLHVMIYLSILGFIQAAIFYRNYNSERLKAANLEANLAKAQLQVLNTQLNPHFLFNTLNAISILIHKDTESADRCITELSDLLRITLKGGQNQEVALKDELDVLRKYVMIQQTLFQDRLKVQWSIQPETLDAAVPNMILQPLVENSIRHGIAPLRAGGSIRISSERKNGRLHLSVSDTGRGIVSEAEINDGVGLANTKNRLWHLYGTRQEFDLKQLPEGGIRVDIRIPFKEIGKPQDENTHIDH